MKKFINIFVLLLLNLHFLSCVVTKYSDCSTNALPNNPKWEMHYDVHSLRDLMLRVDKLTHIGTVKDSLMGYFINFERYELLVTMKQQLPGGPIFNPYRKPQYRNEDIQINLWVSDTLSDSIIANLKKEDPNEHIEKGYINQHNFLYINNWENTDVYILINLHSKRAYKLEQDKENLRRTYRSLDSFVRYNCLQGIQFIGKNGAFSFGEYYMY